MEPTASRGQRGDDHSSNTEHSDDPYALAPSLHNAEYRLARGEDYADYACARSQPRAACENARTAHEDETDYAFARGQKHAAVANKDGSKAEQDPYEYDSCTDVCDPANVSSGESEDEMPHRRNHTSGDGKEDNDDSEDDYAYGLQVGLASKASAAGSKNPSR